MDEYKKTLSAGMGPGGIKCYCCGPSQKFKKKFTRIRKKSFRRNYRDEVNEELQQYIEDNEFREWDCYDSDYWDSQMKFLIDYNVK